MHHVDQFLANYGYFALFGLVMLGIVGPLIPDETILIFAGIAVHIASRIESNADPSEVLVSSTVKDLVAGSDIRFQNRGEHQLKGVPGAWQLFALED